MPADLLAPPAAGAVLPRPDAAEPARYRVTPRVPIMPVHEDNVPVQDPQTGRLVRDENGRPRRRKLLLDEAALRAMAAEANERSARGHDCHISIGHIQLFEPDEKKQPEVVGFMRNYSVGPITDGSGAVLDPTPHLFADLHIDRDRHRETTGYPHRSPEFDPNYADPSRSTLDSLALLRRHPKFPMGLLRYQRDPTGPAEGEADDPDPPADESADPPADRPAAPEAPDPGETRMPMSPEELQALVEQLAPAIEAAVMSHLDQLAGQADDPADPAGDAPPAAPVQNAEAAPSGTNTFAPAVIGAKDDDEEDDTVQNCDGGKQKMQYARDFSGIRAEIAQLKAENAALKRRVEQDGEYLGTLYVQNARDGVARNLDALEAEGIIFDRASEEKFLLEKLEDDADRDEHFARMKRQYARHSGNNGFSDVEAPRRRETSLTAADSKKIARLAIKNGIDFPTAKARVAAGTLSIA